MSALFVSSGALKVREMTRHFPPWHECCCVVECFATYPVGRGCTFYLKSYINKLPRLASVSRTEVVLFLCRHKE